MYDTFNYMTCNEMYICKNKQTNKKKQTNK